MTEALSGVNVALLILAAGYIFFVTSYQYRTRNDEKSEKLSSYAWSVWLGAAGIIVTSLLFFLYDANLIFRSQQRDLNFIARVLFTFQMITAYSAFDWRIGRFIVAGSLIIGTLIYAVMILFG